MPACYDRDGLLLLMAVSVGTSWQWKGVVFCFTVARAISLILTSTKRRSVTPLLVLKRYLYLSSLVEREMSMESTCCKLFTLKG